MMWAQIVASIKDITDQWSKMSMGKKVGVSAIVVLVLSCMVALGAWVGEKSYAPLYTDLQPDASIELVKILQAENIPYLVSNDGATVSIPPELVQPTLMKLAVRGMPAGQKPGLELFDKESFGTSSYVQRINYVRAIQGELTRTISTLKSIRKSNVHISIPPRSSFLEQTEDPKASVVLELVPGSAITKEEVRGIQNLVASSVEGLRPERVTIVDANGRALSRQGDVLSSLSTTMLERQQQIESELEARVEDLVTRIVGQGNVVARVNAELDFDPLKEQETLFDPEQTALRSQEKQENNMDASRPTGSAPAGSGAQAALPAGPAPASDAAPGTSAPQPTARQSVAKTTDRADYEVSKRLRTKEKALGGVKRISVAVLVNNVSRAPAAGAEGSSPTGITEEQRKTIEKLVRDAVGYVDGRDSVSIEAAEFATENLDKADQMLSQQERRALIFSIIRYGTVALFVLLFFLIVVRPFVRWLTGLSTTKVEQVLPKTVEELEEITDETTKALPGLANLPLIEETVDLEKAEGELLKEKINAMIDQAPHKAAQIITDWIAVVDQQNAKKKGKG